MRQNFKEIREIIEGIDKQILKDGDKVRCVGEAYIRLPRGKNLNSLWLNSNGVLEVVYDDVFVAEDHDKVWVSGTLRCVEFFGWYIEAEYMQRNKY